MDSVLWNGTKSADHRKKSIIQLLLSFCLHIKNHLQSYKEQNKLKREFTPQLGDNTKKALLTNSMAAPEKKALMALNELADVATDPPS